MGTVKTIPITAVPARPSEQPGAVIDQVTADQQYIAHIVQDGETPDSIAAKYNVSLPVLRRENTELDSYDGKIYAGQVVYIPNVKSQSVYTVRAGDTPTSVARHFNVPLDELRAANRGVIGDNDLLLIGDSLMIPSARPPVTHAPAPQPMAPNASTSAARPLATPTPMEPSLSGASGVALRPGVAGSPKRTPQAKGPVPAPAGAASAAAPGAAVAPAAVAPAPAAAHPAPAAAPPAGSAAAPSLAPVPALPEPAPHAPEPAQAPMPTPAPLDVTGLTPASFGSHLNPYTGRVLQRMLNRTGADLVVDGDVGSGTRAAISAFQKSHELSGQRGVRSGAIDARTWEALQAAAADPAPLSGVEVKVTKRDLEDPDIRGTFGMVSALAHDDPRRFRSLLQMERAHDRDGTLIIDRATLQAIAGHVRSRGYHIKQDADWTYNQAQSVADLVGNSLNINRVYTNHTYDGLMSAAVSDEVRKWMRTHPGYQMRQGFDVAAWIKACASAESSFNPRETSGAGALGMMQFMPEAAHELGLRDRRSVEGSIRAAVRYVLTYMPRYKDRSNAEFVAFLAAAYNHGPYGTVDTIPDIAETKEHGRIVDSLYSLYTATNEPRPAPPRPPAAPRSHHSGHVSHPAHHSRGHSTHRYRR